MVRTAIAITGSVLIAATAALSEPVTAKDQSRLPAEAFDLAQDQAAPPPAPAPETPPAAGPGTEEPAPEDVPAMDGDEPRIEGEEPGGEDELSLGEIPILEVVELTPETARKAIDAYALIKDKYQDADLESYETLQDFVDQAPDGKAFDADVKSFGFAAVNEWNTAVTSIAIAYASLDNDPTAEIKQQIEELKADTELAQDMRDRMIASLTATIPSPNNLQVVRALRDDPAYAEKLKLLETEQESE